MQEIDDERSNGLMLVGIGASAGGIDALLRFFEHTPPDSGLAFAVVLHALPDHESRLAEALQTKTRMPVTRVAEVARVERNCVYFVPPDKQVFLSGGHIRLAERRQENACNAPIDLFFRELAVAYKDKAIAVVMSGADADGSLGLGRVREEGGVSIAQDPSEAEQAAMPRSAIETGWVDFILPAGSMPQKLLSLKQNAGRIQLTPAEKSERNFEEDALLEMLALLRARTRQDFTNYKHSTLLRRIERRLQVTESEDIPAYLEHVRHHPAELQGLLRDLLISMTSFLRNPDAFRIQDLKLRRAAVLFYDITERKRLEANLAFLAEVSQDLARLTSIDEIMQTVGAKIGVYLNLSLCAFAEINDAADEGVVTHDWHRADVPGIAGVHRLFDFVTDEFKRASRAGEITVVRDTVADERTDAEKYAALKIGSFIILPHVNDGEWRPLLAIYHSEAHDWRDDEIELMRELTTRLWMRLERARAEEALRLSEERLRLVLESATDYAIVLMNAEGRYTSWNPGAEKMFGYTEAEAVGQPSSLIFTPEDRAAGLPEQELQVADTAGRATDERWHMRKDGTRFYVSGVAVSLGRGRGYAKIARDLTAQKQAQEELQRAWEDLEKRVGERTAELAEANSALREEVRVRRRAEQERLELLRRIVTTQEDERRRISRELHDQLGQSLTALRLKLEGLKGEAGESSKLQGRITELVEVAQRLDADVDFLAWELRPSALDDLGLTVALSNYAHEWSKHLGVKVNFHSAGLEDARLAPLVETSLYRIAQEALNNVSKHAEATSVDLLLERRGHNAVLIIEDNGQGFNPDEMTLSAGGRGMGLIGMRERAALVGGSIEIESAGGEGTTIFVRIPF
jgi:PAS domain S-box-containing protein